MYPDSVWFCCSKFRRGGGIERNMLDVVGSFHERIGPSICFARRFDETVPEYAHVKPVRLGADFLPDFLRDYGADRSLRRRLARKPIGDRVLFAFNRTGVADIAVCGGTHRGLLAGTGRKPKLRDRLQLHMEVRCYDHVRRIVAHSASLVRELREMYGLPKEKVRLIYPPVAASRFSAVGQEERQRLRHRFGFKDDELVLAFPSMDHRRKGLGPIMKALEGTKLPVRLAIAGRKPRYASDPRATFLGYLTDVEDLYRAADYTILASIYEPLALAAIESVLCGTPTLLSDRIGALEVLSADAARAFDPTRPENLRRLLEEVVAIPAKRLDNPAGHVAYDVSLKGHIDRLAALVDEVHVLKQAGR